MSPFPNVYRRAGSNRWQFALPAPTDLTEHFATQWAVRKSLGTADLREANAKAKALHAEWEERFTQLRRGQIPAAAVTPNRPALNLTVVDLTPQVIQEAANLLYARTLESDEAGRMAVISGAAFEAQSLMLEIEAAQLKRAYATGDSSPVDNLLPNWMAALGIEVRDADPLRPALAREVVKSRLRAIEARRARQAGELVDTPPEPSVEALEAVQGSVLVTMPPADKPAHLLTLRDLLKLWSNKAKKPDAKTIETAERVVSQFEQVCGNPPLVKLTRSDGLKFRDWLLAQGQSPRTAEDRMGYVGRLIRYEMREQQRLTVNPWQTIRIEGSGDSVVRRKAIKADKLAALFSIPLFQSYALPTVKTAGRDAAYWLPILGAYTGARVTELAQLKVGDILREGGLWCISIADTEDWQSLKNAPSERVIPMHSELVRLGLPEYTEALRTAGHDRLFPMAPVSKLNNAGGPFATWFSKLKAANGWGPENTFHSFRHTIETMLKRKKKYPFDINAYTGHKQPGGDADNTYSHPEPSDLVDVAEAVQHDDVNLPRMFPPVGWTPPPLLLGLLTTKPRGGSKSPIDDRPKRPRGRPRKATQ